MRRFVDIVIGSAVLSLLSPLLLLVALAIVIESPGNPFYLARRAGQYGRIFRMWKFRSMVRNASVIGSAITSRRDARITRVGALLRKTKIDELPQFINVVLGDMTLVGPRPEAPQLVARYTESQKTILAVKPGVTGPVQLESGEESECIPNGVDADEYYATHLMADKIRRDLSYLENRTAWSDTRLVFATAMYVFRSCNRP
jgi:lipopolysaccharide/colanic/teichoic acid biosynthesis glycosyltransferase